MTDKIETKDPHAELMGLIDALDTSAAADGRIDCHPSIRTEYAYEKAESFARTLTDRLTQAEQESTALNLTMDRQTKRIAALEAQLEAVGAGGVGAMVPNEVESRELILQHAVMDSVQLMNGCVMTSPTLQKAHELLRKSLWDYSEAVSGTRKATDHSTLLVRALRSLEDTEKCHGSTTRRTVLMADIRSATIASAQPAPAVVGPVANIVKDLLQSARIDGYTHEQQAFIRSIADRIDGLNLTPQQEFEDEIITLVLCWYDSQETDSPQEVSVLRYHIRQVIAADRELRQGDVSMPVVGWLAKQEAQIHAQEARTANATIAEIYQLCTGATGEPGNWHGAEPVRAALVAKDVEIEGLTAERDALKVDAERYRLLRRGQHWSVIDGIGEALRAEALDAAINSAIAKEADK